MSVLNKILIAIGTIVMLGALGLIIYQQHELKTQQTAIQTQVIAQQQLIDGIVRSQSQYATAAQLAQMASDNGINLKAIQDNLNQLGSQLASINVAVVDSTPQNGTNLPSTGTGTANPTPPTPVVENCPNGGTVTCPNTDPFGYQKAQQTFALNEDFGTLQVPFGSVGFSAFQQNPWSTTIPQRQYNIDTVVGTDEKERQTFYNKLSIKVGTNSYSIPISSASTEQVYPSATWSWWNPRVFVGLDGDININHIKGDFVPNVSLGIMSYGQYKTTPDFSILEVGVGYSTVGKTASVVITPVSYNLGRNLFAPLMNNFYLGPNLTINTDGSFAAGAGLRVGL
jgi:hypothetical protein